MFSLPLSIFTFISLFPSYKCLFKLVSGTVLLFGLEHAVHIFFATVFSNKSCTMDGYKTGGNMQQAYYGYNIYNTRYCYTCTIQYKVLFHVHNTIPRTVTRVQYITTYSYTCKVQYNALFHMYNTVQDTVTRVQYNIRYCYTCTIQYKVLLHVCNKKQGTVTSLQYNTWHCYACTIQ